LLFKDFKKRVEVFDDVWDESLAYNTSIVEDYSLKYQDYNENSTNSGRKLQVAYCGGSYTNFDRYIDGSNGCVSVDCTAWLLSTLKVQMKMTVIIGPIYKSSSYTLAACCNTGLGRQESSAVVSIDFFCK
jgi:hypothetical protein